MRPAAALLLLALTPVLSAQETAPPLTTLQSSTKLVVVDVIAEDKAGHPVRSLKASDFRLTESGKPEVIRTLDEFAATTSSTPGLKLPQLPPGAFLDYEPVASSGALNVILLDSLNTPQEDQARLRRELELYVSHLRPGTRIAIFGLATRLFLLQGFTSDPAALQHALKKATARKSPLLESPTGYSSDPSTQVDLLNGSPQAADADRATQVLHQFDAEGRAMQTRLRVQLTLDAFAVLTRYLAQFSGRKNLVWFSGSFPTEIVPDPSLKDPLGLSQIDPRQFRQTINLLTRAQVAVYPIDARGLAIDSAYAATDASITQQNPRFSPASATGVLNDPTRTDSAVTVFNNEEITRHATMQAIANATGGKAFYNNNDLSQAISGAITAGSDFYTLSYRSSDQKEDGAYRPIHVEMAAGSTATNVRLHYRPGYFADQPTRLDPQHGAQDPDSASSPYSLSLQRAADRYTEAIMARGAPTPTEILFEARVLPDKSAPQSGLSPGNRPNPRHKAAGPFRTYTIDVAALTSQFTLVQVGNNKAGGAELLAYLYDTDGNLLLLDGRTIRFNLAPQAQSSFFASPLHLQLTLSAPIATPSVLRLALRDVPSNRSGVMELPTGVLDHPAAAPLPSISLRSGTNH